MTSLDTSHIVHESEVQRQHIRLPIPAHAIIQNNAYALKDLSSGGFSLKDVKGTFPVSRNLPISLRFTFPHFSMDVPLESQIQYYNEGAHQLGCRFINLKPEQISAINHVISAYIAGDIVTADNMLTIISRDNFAKIRKQSSANENVSPRINLRRQIPGLIAILLMGVLATAFIASNIYRHVFTIETSEAVVMADDLNLSSPISGKMEYLIQPNSFIVTEGEEIAAVDSGAVVPRTIIKSPCNCYVAERYMAEGDYISVDKPLVRLIPISSRPWVQSLLSHRAASDLQIGNRATIKILGVRNPIEGQIVRMKSGRTGQTPAVLVDIQPDKRIPIDLADRPAKIVFLTR
jgi:alginate biosynthesis protein Alg44